MLIDRLVAYADTHMRADDVPPPYYQHLDVSHIIELDAAGCLLGVTSQAYTVQRGKATRTLYHKHTVPSRTRTSEWTMPLLLADTAEYLLGRSTAMQTATAAQRERLDRRAQDRHAASLALHRACYQETGESALGAVCTFLEQGGNLGALPGRLLLCVEGTWPHTLPVVQRWWAAYNDQDLAPPMVCHICGTHGPVVRCLRARIHGLVGCAAGGVSLQSADEPTYQSYGLAQSTAAPLCPTCAHKAVCALNTLIKGEATHITLGSVTCLGWTRQPVRRSLLDTLDKPTNEKVRDLHAAPRTAQPQPPLDANAYYAAWLMARGGRPVVLDWVETTLEEAQGHVAQWFTAQAIIQADGQPPEPLPIWRLVRALVREQDEQGEKEAVRRAATGDLLRTALTGCPVPLRLLHAVLARCRAERAVSTEHAAIIKLCLMSRGEGTIMQELDPQSTDPAYLSGMLVGEIINLQRAALGEVNASIRDIYLDRASRWPARVLPDLLRKAEVYLGLLYDQLGERDAYWAISDRIYALQERFNGDLGYPVKLTVQEQGRFMLGYYHQQAAARRAIRAALDRKEKEAAKKAAVTKTTAPAA